MAADAALRPVSSRNLLFTPSAQVGAGPLTASHAGPFAALARRMALPQTATLSLGGLLAVPETDGGRAWHEAFSADGSELPVRMTSNRSTLAVKLTSI